VDSAAGLGPEAYSAIEMADEVIIVTNPEMPAITDALKAIKFAEQMKKTIKGVIMTRVRKDDIELSPETVKDMLEAPILGMIPEHADIRRSLSKKDAVIHTYPKSDSARAYKEIAARLLDIEYDSTKDRHSFWKRIFKRRN
jgi:MinD-like ATPase involved in chromosome partitioning or flagellar assembly